MADIAYPSAPSDPVEQQTFLAQLLNPTPAPPGQAPSDAPSSVNPLAMLLGRGVPSAPPVPVTHAATIPTTPASPLLAPRQAAAPLPMNTSPLASMVTPTQGNSRTPSNTTILQSPAGGGQSPAPSVPTAAGSPLAALVPNYARTDTPTLTNPAGLPLSAPQLQTPVAPPIPAPVPSDSSIPSSSPPLSPLAALTAPVRPDYIGAPTPPTYDPAPQQKIGLGGLLARLAGVAVGGSLGGGRAALGAEEGVVGEQNQEYQNALNQWKQQQDAKQAGYNSQVTDANDRNAYNEKQYTL